MGDAKRSGSRAGEVAWGRRGRLGPDPPARRANLSPRDVDIRCADLLRNMKRNQAALIKITHRGFKLMNIQHPASGWQLRSSPAQLGDCACVAGARLCRHTHARSRSPGQLQSSHGEPGRLFRATAEAQERAAGARHPQECGGGAEAQAGTANEEPGETRRGLTALPSPTPFLSGVCGR